MDELPLEIPGVLVMLAELEGMLLDIARDRRKPFEVRIEVMKTLHGLLLNRIAVIERRDTAAALRVLEAGSAVPNTTAGIGIDLWGGQRRC